MEHDSTNFFASKFSDIIFFDKECCREIAQNVAPKIVSGLVVKIFNDFFCPSSGLIILKSISAPIDFPIQFDCMVFTLSGQFFKVSRSDNNSSE